MGITVQRAPNVLPPLPKPNVQPIALEQWFPTEIYIRGWPSKVVVTPITSPIHLPDLHEEWENMRWLPASSLSWAVWRFFSQSYEHIEPQLPKLGFRWERVSHEITHIDLSHTDEVRFTFTYQRAYETYDPPSVSIDPPLHHVEVIVRGDAVAGLATWVNAEDQVRRFEEDPEVAEVEHIQRV